MKMSNKLLDKDKVAQCEGKQDIKQKEKNSSYMVFLLIQNFLGVFCSLEPRLTYYLFQKLRLPVTLPPMNRYQEKSCSNKDFSCRSPFAAIMS